MSTHTIQTDIEVRFSFPGLAEGDYEVEYPKVEIEYDYSPGSPAFTPRGEYGPIDPPEAAQLSFRSAKMIDGNGFHLEPKLLQEIAEEWLDDAGREYAIDCAETDLKAMRHAQ